MNKVVVNTCYGGYELSAKALAAIHALKHPGEPVYFYRKVEYTKAGTVYEKSSPDDKRTRYVLTEDFGDVYIESNNVYNRQGKSIYKSRLKYEELPRHDKDLVKVVEELGAEASGPLASLVIEEIDSDLYRIEEYDGSETVVTPKEDMRRYVKINKED